MTLITLGLTLAALGILPPILAAAQSLPDLGILANSSRLLRQSPQQPVAPKSGS
jgi:cation transport ATPase